LKALNIHKYWFLLVVLSFLLVFSNCSNTKYLKDKEVLYKGAYVKVQSPKKTTKKTTIKNKSDIEADLKQLSIPKPNRRVFNTLAPRLWVYNKTTKAKKRMGKWLHESYGEAPVLFDETDVETSIEKMKNYLFRNGYFVNRIEAKPLFENQRVEVDYKVYINHQYTFGSINYPKTNRGIDQVVNFYNKESVLKTGEPFSLNKLNKERERITDAARNSGYFRFAKDYIFFEFDSTKNNYQVDVTLKINDADSITQHKRSFIRNVTIYSDYNPAVSNDQTNLDSLKLGSIQYFFKKDVLKHATLKNAVLFKKGQIFRTNDYNTTINKLINLGIYKFVNIQISPYQIENYDSLDATIFLTAKDKIEFEADLEVNSKINPEEAGLEYNLGSAIALSHNNLNTFRGAERFIFSVLGGVEFEPINKTDSSNLINAFELSAQGSLIIPRFWLPFRNTFNLDRLVPKTIFGASGSYLNTDFYKNISFNINYGYQWSNTLKRQHRLNPITVSYFNYFDGNDVFREQLEDNLALRRSFEPLLLFGTEYTYIYNSIFDQNNKHYYYFKGKMELIGNLLNSFIQADSTIVEQDTIVEKKLFNVKTAQFVKFDAEAKYYRIFSKKHLLATRFTAGIGIPFGNSKVLPNSRQYYVGGTNSLRAFKIRTVGPGLDYIDDSSGNTFANQTGEIKLEANVEYRFDIAKYLEGALFIDMGNVWNIGNRDDPANNLDQNFMFKRFLKDIAVGTGLGLRLDFSYFIIRGDLGIPLRKQWDLNDGFKWINRDRFALPTELSDKFVFNIAIGYPF